MRLCNIVLFYTQKQSAKSYYTVTYTYIIVLLIAEMLNNEMKYCIHDIYYFLFGIDNALTILKLFAARKYYTSDMLLKCMFCSVLQQNGHNKNYWLTLD